MNCVVEIISPPYTGLSRWCLMITDVCDANSCHWTVPLVCLDWLLYNIIDRIFHWIYFSLYLDFSLLMTDDLCGANSCWFSDLLHILSYLPKDLNFVNHSSYIGWREYDYILLLLYVSTCTNLSKKKKKFLYIVMFKWCEHVDSSCF